MSIKWEEQKEKRNGYCVRYLPPFEGSTSFAVLTLVWARDVTADEIVRAMETEFEYWLSRFEVPIMVTSFNGVNDLINLDEVMGASHLMGYRHSSDDIEMVWGLIPDAELPEHQTNLDHWKLVYSDLPFKTSEDFKKAADKTRRNNKIAVALLVIWLGVIPFAVALLGWANPIFGGLVLAYSLCKSFILVLQLLGKIPISKRKTENLEKERKKEHYYYHCERNPTAFQSLRSENFRTDEKDRIQKEF